MTDLWVWLGITAIIVWYVYSKTYWFRDTDKIAEKYAEKLAKRVEEEKESGSIAGKKRSEEYQNQLKQFGTIYENYHHLVERYKHDPTGKQVKKDWESYLTALKTKFDCEMDYAADLPVTALQNTKRKDYKATVAMEEIEKRFKKYITA